MANPEDDLKARELEALRTQVAALTARVHTLEVKAGIEPQIAATPAAPVSPRPTEPAKQGASVAPPPPPSGPEFKAVPSFHIPVTRRETADLEGTIGKLWLNRVGIFALLFGVAFFLKYAFDNNWIGPIPRPGGGAGAACAPGART